MIKSQICKGKYDGKHIKTHIILDYVKRNIITICVKTNIKKGLEKRKNVDDNK